MSAGISTGTSTAPSPCGKAFFVGENHMDNFIVYNTDDGQAKVSLLACE